MENKLSLKTENGCYLESGPLISVVVPVYNTEKLLPRCVDSILSQTYYNLELILVNDASPDESADIIEHYCQQDERVHCVTHETNRGLFQARISGAETARGKYLAFVDSDDYISVDWFRMLLKKAEADQADIVVGEWCNDFEGGAKTYINLDPFRIRDYHLEGDEVLAAFMQAQGQCFSWTIVWNKLYRKSCWDLCMDSFRKFAREHGHMNMWEDITFSSALWCHAKRVSNVHGVLYFYYRHSAALTSGVAPLKKNRKYIADASAAIAFMEDQLRSLGMLERYVEDFRAWKTNYVSIVYDDLAVSKGLRWAERSIRAAFKYEGEFVSRSEVSFFYSLMTELHPSFSWEERIKKRIVSSTTKVVSFDIFDTLILRPFFYPTDLFILLSDEVNLSTAAYVDFAAMRQQAEAHCRQRWNLRAPGREEITLDEIYEELKASSTLDHALLENIKKREVELELKLCTVRRKGHEFYELARDAGKMTIFCSDMYLSERVVREILNRNGYDPTDRLYLSSELHCSKHYRSLFARVQKDLKIKNKTMLLHIGDNWGSDVEHAAQSGWQSDHLSKPIDMFCNINPGIYSGEAFHWAYQNNNLKIDYNNAFGEHPANRCMLALAANRFFDNPFVSFNRGSDFNADPNYIGYAALGPHLLALCEWIASVAKREHIPTVHFVSRDGYLVKKAFDLCGFDSVRSDYIYVSRKSLLLADVRTADDLASLSRKMNPLQGSPKKLQKWLSPLIPPERKAEVQTLVEEHDFIYDKHFYTIAEYERCLKLFCDKLLDFSRLPAYREELRRYFAEQIQPGDYIFDIGYSGRAEAALSSLLGFPIGSLYVHVNSDVAAKRQSKYQCPSECFYDYKPCITGVMREHVLMELGPSCIGYGKRDGQLVPMFDEYEIDYPSRLVTEAMQAAALEFVRDYQQTFGHFRENMYFQREAASTLFEYWLHYSKPFDRALFGNLPFEDDLGLGRSVKALDFWNQELAAHNLHHPSVLVAAGSSSALPPELKDLYADGVFVKFYKLMNRLFPLGSFRRTAIKKLAGFFMRH